MKKFVALAIFILAVCSCGTTKPDLYYWGGMYDSKTTAYEQYTYRNYKKQSPESICQLIVTYEKMINNPGGSRKVPPPGICAEYAYLLCQEGTADTFQRTATEAQKKAIGSGDYGALFRQKSAELFEKEMELYPESALFIRPMLNKIKSQQ